MITDFIVDVDIAEYYAGTLTEVPALSQSVGRHMLRSAKHGWAAHPRLGGKPRAPSPQMTLGNIFDELVIGRGVRIAVCNVPHNKTGEVVSDFKTNEAKAWRDAQIAAGKLPITLDKSDELRGIATNVIRELQQHGVVLDGCAQACLLWVEKASNGNPVQCCALLDMLWPDIGLIRDFKTGDDNRPEKLGFKVNALGGHMQAAAYMSAFAAVFPALAGRVRFENVWMETEFPHVPFVSEMDGQALAVGRVLWQRAVDRWEQCLSTDKWPGYTMPGQVHTVELPQHALTDLYGESDES